MIKSKTGFGDKINKSTIVNVIIVLLIVAGATVSMNYRNRAEKFCESEGFKYYSFDWNSKICYTLVPVTLADGRTINQMIFIRYE